MALNPVFQSQQTRRLPLAYGYVLGTGDQVLSTVVAGITDTTQAACFLMGEGEWDGIEMLTVFGGGMRGRLMSSPPGTLSYIQPFYNVNLHGGSFTPKGLGVSQVSPGSFGPDQSIDEAFALFPAVTPPQTFSGVAYVMYQQTSPNSVRGGTLVVLPFTPTGVWRTTRCRTFDASGNVVSYGFTCNPAWHFVDAILRYKIKPQQPALAGLTAAERACFNWPSIVANAARNDAIQPGGNPLYTGNYLFAADATLTNILELILRVSRSFHYVRQGQIFLVGDDARASTFTVSAKHVVPGSLQMYKKSVAKSPNSFIPQYRELAPPAVCEVASVGPGDPTNDPPNTMIFTTATPDPFLAGDVVVYSGSSNPAAHGEYIVFEPSNNDSGQNTVGLSYILNEVYVSGVYNGAIRATGGVLGSNSARFRQYAPTNVQHRSHQKMVAAQAPGLMVQPKIIPVYYDCGNSTFEQTNRLMKFERDSSLGPDITGWKAPISGTLTCFLEAVDASGRLLSEINPRDVIVLDDWVTPELAGSYIVQDPIVLIPPAAGSVGQIQIALLQYFPSAYVQTADPPGESYATVANSSLPLTGVPPVANAAWVLAMSPTFVPSGGTITVAIANLSLHIMGHVTPTTYTNLTWTGMTAGKPYILYVDDPAGLGLSTTTGTQAGALPLTANPAGRYIVYAGIIAVPTYRI